MASSSRVRFALTMIPLAVLGVVGTLTYRHFTAKDRLIEEQKRVIKELEGKLDRAWAEELVADVRVRRVGPDPNSGDPSMDLTFVQYRAGTEEPLLERTMTLPGDEFYIDALVVHFDRKLVEAGDGLKGKSLFMFRRAFGDAQKPNEGVPLFAADPRAVVPELMQVDARPSSFETELWAKFWTLANDPRAAAAQGIKVAQGEAPHMRAVSGQVYKLTLRSAGGLEITPRLPAAIVGDP